MTESPIWVVRISLETRPSDRTSVFSTNTLLMNKLRVFIMKNPYCQQGIGDDEFGIPFT
jgi:hypothetical protein